MSIKSRKTFVPSGTVLVVCVLFIACAMIVGNVMTTTVSADGEKPLKIGVMNLQTVMKNFATLGKFHEEWSGKAKEIEDSLIALEKQIAEKKREMEHTLPTTGRYAELYREISLLQQQLEFDSQYLQKQHLERGEKVQRQFFAEIEAAVKEYAAQNSFTAVFMSQDLPQKVRERAPLNSYFQDVMYYDKSIDISMEITKKLNGASGPTEPQKEKEGQK
ncbi:MAG: OmpH/Skp family outer membrane protein [Planctomycetota bacterium]